MQGDDDGLDFTDQELGLQSLEAVPGTFCLGGLSMGGIVAMEVVRQAPERVAGLALMDTNPLAEADEVKTRRGPQMEAVRQGGLRQVMRDELKPNYLADGPDRGAILELCMDMADALGPKVFADQSHAVQHRPDQVETLKSVDVPSLVLCGKDDRLCPVARHELMHELIDGSTLSVIPGAGHMPTLEQPELTNRKVTEWLTR